MSNPEKIPPELAATIQRCLEDSPLVTEYRLAIEDMNEALSKASLRGASSREKEILTERWREKIERILGEAWNEFQILLGLDLFTGDEKN